MLRFVVRLIGAVLLAIAIVFAVGDIARSMASGTARLTPFSQALAPLGAEPPAAAIADPGLESPDQAEPSWNRRLGEALEFSADWPASVVVGVLAFVMLAAGQPRRARRRLSGQN